MTDRELSRALKCCAEGDCPYCPSPLEWRGRCQQTTMLEAATRIETLHSENAALNERDRASKELIAALHRMIDALERNVYLLKHQSPWHSVVKEGNPKLTQEKMEQINNYKYGLLAAPIYLAKIEGMPMPVELLFNGKAWTDLAGCVLNSRFFTVSHWMEFPKVPLEDEQ